MLDTLSNVKSRLGIAVNTHDDFLTQQIQLVSDVIEAYCRRKFIRANYKQTFYGDEIPATRGFYLFHYPVSSILSFKEDTQEATAEDYRLHSQTGHIRGTFGRSFFHAYSVTEVEYTAGYETCPSPVLAVLDSIVQERYNKKTSGVDLNFGSDVQRISIPGAISIDFDYTLTSNERKSAYGTILGNNANILDDWRSERAVIGSGKLEYMETI